MTGESFLSDFFFIRTASYFSSPAVFQIRKFLDEFPYKTAGNICPLYSFKTLTAKAILFTGTVFAVLGKCTGILRTYVRMLQGNSPFL